MRQLFFVVIILAVASLLGTSVVVGGPEGALSSVNPEPPTSGTANSSSTAAYRSDQSSRPRNEPITDQHSMEQTSLDLDYRRFFEGMLDVWLKTVAPGRTFELHEVQSQGSWAYAIAYEHDVFGDRIPYNYIVLLARNDVNRGMYGVAPSFHSPEDYNSFLSSFPDSLIDDSAKAYWSQIESVTGVLNFSAHRLPWPGGQNAVVVRRDGENHGNQIDFDILGSSSSGDVYASKPGTVVFVKESSNSGACDANSWRQANMVVVQHDTSEYSWYVHLAYGSVPVTVGDQIGFGTKVGVEGNTGYSCGVHLHYMGSTGHTSWTDPADPNAAPWGTGITAVDFDEASWSNLTAGQAYTSQNNGAVCSSPGLNVPVDGYVHTSTDRTIAFNWSAPSCIPAGYTFRVKTSSDMNSGGTTLFDEGVGGTQISKQIGSEWDNTDLYWSVRACKPCTPYTPSPWATVRRFRVSPGSTSCVAGADQVALFVDSGYGGQCVVKSAGDYPNPAAIGLPNDSVSSVKVGSNVVAVLCKDDNFSGGCEDFLGDDPNLSDNGIGSDQVSSARVQLRSGGTCVPNSDQIALFVDANFSGQCVVKGVADYPNPGSIGLPNDAISSVKVGGNAQALLCRDDNFFSTCELFTGNDSYLGDNALGDNQVSSAAGQVRGSPPPSPAIPTLVFPNDNARLAENVPVTLSWNESSYASMYAAEYWPVATAGIINSGRRTQTNWSLNVLPIRRYQWHVEAYNSAGWSGWSQVNTFEVIPSGPSQLSAQAPSCARVNLSWVDNSSGETGYQVVRDGLIVTTLAPNVTSYGDNGVSPSTVYNYYVRAAGPDNTVSSPSNMIGILVPACATDTPTATPTRTTGPTATHTSTPTATYTWTPTPTSTPAYACPPITAWRGEYWNNQTLSGAPALCRNDANIDFEWYEGSPAPQIQADSFSARWTRSLNLDAGTYRFTMLHDDGARLYIDGALVIQNWCSDCRDTDIVDLPLTAGTHAIRMEMLENAGWAAARLSWSQLPTPTPTATPTTSSGQLWTWQREAELGTITNPAHLAVQTTPEASACDYVRTIVGWESGALEFSVTIPANGNYWLWARAKGVSLGGNSFWVSVDSQSEFHYSIPQNGTVWTWGWSIVHDEDQAEGPLYLSADNHIVRFRSREINSQLDKIIFTNDNSFVPGTSDVTPCTQVSPTPTPTRTITPTPTRTITPTPTRTITPTPTRTITPTPTQTITPMPTRTITPTPTATASSSMQTWLAVHFENTVDGEQGEIGYASGVTYAPGRYGQGVVIDGNDTLWYAAASNLMREGGTIEFWLKPFWNGDSAATYTVFELGDATLWYNRMLITKDGLANFRFIIWSPTREYGVGSNVGHWVAGQWHHVEVTWNTTSIALYLDDTLVDREDGIQLPASLDQRMYVGSRSAGFEQVNAVIDDFVIYANQAPPATATPTPTNTLRRVFMPMVNRR